MDDFNLFSHQDRQDVSYGACVGGAVVLGAAVGRFVLLPGLLAGAAAGLAFGLLSCKRLAPAIEKKIFSGSEPLSEGELASVLKVLRDQTGVQSKSDVMFLFGQARAAGIARGEALRGGSVACVLPRVAAAQLLAQKSLLG